MIATQEDTSETPDAKLDEEGVEQREDHRLRVPDYLILAFIFGGIAIFSGPAGIVFLIATVFVFAPWLACMIGILTQRPVQAERLVGWKRVLRIAMWYVGMAIVGVVAYLGVDPLKAMIAPKPYLAIAPLTVISVNEFSYWRGTWGLAMLAYIAMTGPLLRDRHIDKLPLRATVILTFYSLTSLLWFVIVYRDHHWEMRTALNGYDATLYGYNFAAIAFLWFTWWLLRGWCSATCVIVWNTALVCWLYWLAHPTIAYIKDWSWY